MTNITRDQVCAAVPRAVAAMRANRGKVALGSLALDAEGNSVSPVSSEAVCWCALGYLAKELGVDERRTANFISELVYEAQFSIDKVRKIYIANDRGVLEGRPLAAIPALEALCHF